MLVVPELPTRLWQHCGPTKSMVKLDRKSTICVSCDVVISKLGQNCQKKMRTLSIKINLFHKLRLDAVATAAITRIQRGSKGYHGDQKDPTGIKRINGDQKDQRVSRVTRVSHRSHADPIRMGPSPS